MLALDFRSRAFISACISHCSASMHTRTWSAKPSGPNISSEFIGSFADLASDARLPTRRVAYDHNKFELLALPFLFALQTWVDRGMRRQSTHLRCVFSRSLTENMLMGSKLPTQWNTNLFSIAGARYFTISSLLKTVLHEWISIL